MRLSRWSTLGRMYLNRIMNRRRLALFLLKHLLAFAACGPLPQGDEAIWIRIPPGDSLPAVAESLAVHGIVKSARSFERFARMGRKHLGIKPGVYPLRQGMAMGAVLVELRRGRPDAVRVRVEEGVWLSELFPVLSRAVDIPVEDLWEAARDSALLLEIGTGGATVEGYLYPTVYYVPVGSTARDVLRQMVDTFQTRWEPEWDVRLDTLGLSRAEIVTLASIVEGEGALHAERPLVASVYHNRLTSGLRLQADPTVVYALGRRTRLYNANYLLTSPYNTYRVDHLPPGPICQPSRESLLAALYAPETEYLYFVATPDGRHVFSRTYSEHLATIGRIRRSASNRSTQSERVQY